MTTGNIIDETGMEIPPENCGNCMYAHSVPQMGQDNMPIIGKVQLVCMHSPPQVLVLTMPTPAGIQTAFRTQFPAVADSMMCHQHDPADSFDSLTGEPINDGSIDPH